MTLLEDWRKIVRRAWSFKLILLSGLLSGCEVALPMMQQAIEPLQLIPIGAFAALALLISIAAAVARVLVQPERDK